MEKVKIKFIGINSRFQKCYITEKGNYIAKIGDYYYSLNQYPPYGFIGIEGEPGDILKKDMLELDTSNLKIITGRSSIHGYILEDYNKAKACNFCINMQLYGLHGWCSYCNKLEQEITGGATGNYSNTAKTCEYFECLPKFLVVNN